MTTQTQTKIFSTRSLFDFILLADVPQPKPYSAADLGYEISEDELAEAMKAPIPGDLLDPATAQISPDEFDTVYTWFIS